jgi:signal transduction histidine kinase
MADMAFANTRFMSTNALKVESNEGVAAAQEGTGRSSDEATSDASPTPIPDVQRPAVIGAITKLIVREIRHPLTAIAINANAARHWLKPGDPNLSEALAAIDRISNDVARISALIDDIGVIGAAELKKSDAA